MINISHDIIIRCQKGDISAFRQLYEETNTFVYSLAIRLLCHNEEAKDIVQECYIRVWKHFYKYRPEIKITTWLYKIVTNLCYDQLKKRKRKLKVVENSYDFAETVSHEDIILDYENSETVLKIAKLCNSLTPKQKIVFVLRDLYDQSMDDVVRISGLSKSSIKSNLYLARQNIRKKLESEDEL